MRFLNKQENRTYKRVSILKLAKLVFIASIVLTMQACSTYSTDRYSLNSNNIVTLKDYQGNDISVGEFTATEPGQTSTTCRAVGPISTPDGETFENYIRNALISEMQIAEVYVENADTVIRGNLNRIKPNSMDGTWDISVTVASNNGVSFTVEELFDYKTSFYGETACNQTAQAMMPAVQNVITKIVTHPKFNELLN